MLLPHRMLSRGIECYHIWAENLQGYIFRILQHFATKLCNFTHFSMLFLAVVIYLHLLA
jgi:hypothetical protein